MTQRVEELLEEIVDQLTNISRHLTTLDNYFYEKGKEEFGIDG